MIVFYDLKYDETREKMIKVSLVKGCETFEIQLESEDITAENVIRKFCDQNDCDFEKAKKTLSVFACFCKDNKNNPIEWCFPLTLTNNLKTTKDYCGRELELSKDCVFKIKRNPLLRISFEKKVSDPVILKLLYQEAKENIERNLYFFSKKQEKKLKKLDKTFVRKTSVESAESSDSTEEDKQSLVGNEANFLSICRELKQYGGFAFNGRIDGSIIASLLHSSKFFGKKREPEKNVAVVINEHGLHVVNLKCPKIEYSSDFDKLICAFLYPENEENATSSTENENESQEENCIVLIEKKRPPIRAERETRVYLKEGPLIDKVLSHYIKDKSRILVPVES